MFWALASVIFVYFALLITGGTTFYHRNLRSPADDAKTIRLTDSVHLTTFPPTKPGKPDYHRIHNLEREIYGEILTEDYMSEEPLYWQKDPTTGKLLSGQWPSHAWLYENGEL